MRSAEETFDGLAGSLSLRARVRCLVQLFGAGTGAALIGVLWCTEDGLPVRAQIGFGVLVAIGLGWAVYSVRALTGRGRLFAADRVIAGWLGLACAVVLAVGLVMRGLPLLSAVPVLLAGGYLATAYYGRRRLQRRLNDAKRDC